MNPNAQRELDRINGSIACCNREPFDSKKSEPWRLGYIATHKRLHLLGCDEFLDPKVDRRHTKNIDPNSLRQRVIAAAKVYLADNGPMRSQELLAALAISYDLSAQKVSIILSESKQFVATGRGRHATCALRHAHAPSAGEEKS